ncbi:MAG: SCO family protein [Flavobacteriales bacterium]|nr:SCO family protein [Flavobacteriales bacterium]MBP6698078.1 SCO family protein [Flavobacteriales bacterium]
MEPASRAKKFAVLGGIAGFVLLLFIFFSPLAGMVEHKFQYLPYFGPKEVNAPGDTTYFTVPPFAFEDQFGRPFTDRSVEGKILVVDFFFTRCGTICPRMTVQMQQLQLKLDDPAYADVVFLSHTVDPENDSAEVLNAYARRYEADTARWKFLTGTKEDLYLLGSEGYFLAAREDVMAPEGFLHSEMFVLVDKDRHIRGYYDGTSTEQVGKLATDLKMLLKEEKIKKRDAALGRD